MVRNKSIRRTATIVEASQIKMVKKNVTLRVNEEILTYLRNREINISDWFEHMVRSLMMDQDYYWVIPRVGKPKLKYEDTQSKPKGNK